MGFGLPTPTQLPFTIEVKPSADTAIAQPGATQPQIKFLAEPFQAAAYRDYSLHFWIDPQNLKLTRTASGSYRDDLQFIAAVYADDGFVENSISITTHVDLAPETYAAMLESGLTFDLTIGIPVNARPMQPKAPAEPNYFYLRTAVVEPSTGRIGAVEATSESIHIPAIPSVASR